MEFVHGIGAQQDSFPYLSGLNTLRLEERRPQDWGTRFQNFCHSIGIENNSVCQYCESDMDSPEHQLFNCIALDDPSRELLSSQVESTDIYDLIFNSNRMIHNIFYERVKFIDSINVDV